MKHQSKGFSLCGSVCASLLMTMGLTAFSIDSYAEYHPRGGKMVQKQDRVVEGTVVDKVTGETIIGATISLKGTGVKAISDINGKFSIDVSRAKHPVLEVSYIGYTKAEIDAEDVGVLTIQLEPSDATLNEVVVVGAGTQKKISVTGSIASIKGDELRAPSSSLTTNFAGKLAGVVAMTNTGEPGQASEFYIRGVGTFGGRATPLILLDDVEISVGDLNAIPAETIKSFTLLKDASATAIYGVRGANGVMLITTKNGSENTKARVNVTLETTYVHPTKFPEFVDGATYMELYNEALLARVPGSPVRYTQEQIDNTRNHVNPYVFPDVNWRDVLFRKGNWNQRANISVQGGGNRATYYMSLQANHDTGIIKAPSDYFYNNNIQNWGYTFQNNIGYKLTRTTKLDLRMNAQIRNMKGSGRSTSDIFSQLYWANPIEFPATFPAQPGDLHTRYGSSVISGETLKTNPLAFMLGSFSQRNENTLNTSLKLEQDLDFVTKGLSFSAMVNWKNWSYSTYSQSINPYYYRVKDDSWGGLDNPDVFESERVGLPGTDFVAETDPSKNNNQTFYLDARLMYNRSFGLHSVGGLLMYMQREVRDLALPQRNQGLSGRVTYDFDNRYWLEFNFGYNGTERLPDGHRFEFFPAVSLGWVASGEKFWKPIENVVNFFKLRGSYGLVGSDDTGLGAGAPHFLFFDTVDVGGGGGFTSGPSSDMAYFKNGPAVNGFAVQNPVWERVQKLDVGVDVELFHQFNLTFDYFHDHRYNILLKRGSWPYQMGYFNAVPWSNIGSVDNWGYEFSANWKKEVVKDLYIDARFNFTYTQNKYKDVDEPAYPYVWQTQTGKPISRTTGYIAEGLFKDEEDIAHHAKQNLGSTVAPGDIKYRDVDGNGIINSDDQVMISPYGSMPRIQYGFGLSVTWKKLDASVFFNGSAKRTVMMNDVRPFGSDRNNMMKFIAENHWSEANPNPNAAYPRLGLTDQQVANNTQPSTYWMRNGNFLRFKTLEIGYSFPFCRVYFSGDNIAVFSPFKNWDPEIWWNTYPLSRSFNLGVQVRL